MSGRTLSTLKENVLDDIFELVGPKNYTWKANGELTLFGRKIKCVGADKVDAEKRIRGQTYAGWYGDEITIQHPTFIKQAITRCSVTNAKIFWTTNPDHPKHYIKVNFLDNKEMLKTGTLKSWHFTLDDNHTLSEEYKNTLKMSFGGVFYDRNIKGLWVIADGLVYGNEFKKDVHILPKQQVQTMLENNEFHDFVAGTDFGYTHPMTGLLYGLKGDPLHPEYYLIDEFYKVQSKTEQLRDWYLAWEKKLNKKIKVIFCDSAEPDRILVLQEAGLKATTSDKQINAGINTVQTLMKNNKVFISNSCKDTIHELESYRYPSDEDSEALQKSDAPIDDDNHALDAKRYVMHNYEKYLIGQRKKAERKKRKRKLRV
jgi:PBSX family phage terminase large subunit